MDKLWLAYELTSNPENHGDTLGKRDWMVEKRETQDRQGFGGLFSVSRPVTFQGKCPSDSSWCQLLCTLHSHFSSLQILSIYCVVQLRLIIMGFTHSLKKISTFLKIRIYHTPKHCCVSYCKNSV